MKQGFKTDSPKTYLGSSCANTVYKVLTTFFKCGNKDLRKPLLLVLINYLLQMTAKKMQRYFTSISRLLRWKGTFQKDENHKVVLHECESITTPQSFNVYERL